MNPFSGNSGTGSGSGRSLYTYSFFGAGYDNLQTDDSLSFEAGAQFYGTYPTIVANSDLKKASVIFGPDWVNSWTAGSMTVDIWKYTGGVRTNIFSQVINFIDISIITHNGGDPSTKQSLAILSPNVSLQPGDQVNVSITTTSATNLLNGDICVTLFFSADNTI